MNLGLESILVATFLILPGFLSSTIQKNIVKDQAPISQWIPVSILRSFVLNAIICAMFIFIAGYLQWTVPDVNLQPTLLALSLSEAKNLNGQLTIQDLAIYLAVLYTIAAAYGLAMGFLWKKGKSVAFARGWTPVSPFPDVWTDALSTEFSSPKNLALEKTEQRKPWVRVKIESGAEVLGMIERSNVTIERDKPIELFLSRVFWINGRTGRAEAIKSISGSKAVGIYVRLDPKQCVEILSAPMNWSPDYGGQACVTPLDNQTKSCEHISIGDRAYESGNSLRGWFSL